MPEEEIKAIRVLVIGTFNPGEPTLSLLTASEKAQFHRIQSSRKFQKFSQVRNFYDRPQNRFWKVVDFVADPDFYQKQSLRTINTKGLKYYSRLDRDAVYKKQTEFCQSKGLFITDIVQAIKPSTFSGIYDNFQDSTIDKASPVWNDGIGSILKKYKPEKVIINFDDTSKSIPNIARKVQYLKASFPSVKFLNLPSTSGAAAKDYDSLIKTWGDELSCLNSVTHEGRLR